MAQATPTDRPDLDIKCAKARPWVRRFVEEYEESGRPWGYAIYEDPVVDDEKMDSAVCRIQLLLRIAQVAVYGGDHREFPKFRFEVLDWPGETDEGPRLEQGSDGEEVLPVKGPKPSSVISPFMHFAEQQQQQPDEGMDAEARGEDTKRDLDYDDEEEDLDDDAEIELGSEDTEEVTEDQDRDPQGENDDDEVESEASDDDADIEFVKDLPQLREHFKWVCQQKKRLRAHQSKEIDRSGIPRGLLRNVFLVIDEDSVDSILGNPPIVDHAWVWAIDPDYVGDVASMTKDGLRDEYYGYMRVRVQQLVNHFWAEMYQGERALEELWEAAKLSLDCAFVSMDPEEAKVSKVSMDVGSVLRVT